MWCRCWSSALPFAAPRACRSFPPLLTPRRPVSQLVVWTRVRPKTGIRTSNAENASDGRAVGTHGGPALYGALSQSDGENRVKPFSVQNAGFYKTCRRRFSLDCSTDLKHCEKGGDELILCIKTLMLFLWLFYYCFYLAAGGRSAPPRQPQRKSLINNHKGGGNPPAATRVAAASSPWRAPPLWEG